MGSEMKNAAVESAFATGTASSAWGMPNISETRIAASNLTERVGGNRRAARVLNEEFDHLHKKIHETEWHTATAERGRARVASMLEELADLGFSWRDIARMVNVSVPAVQKWRRGEGVSGASRNRVAALLAACDLITRHYMIDEIASWFDMPLIHSVPVTPIDLYASERPDLVFEFANGHVGPEELLTLFEPDWRERYRSEFEVFEASDGRRSIRMKE